jgi:hypothetical protein
MSENRPHTIVKSIPLNLYNSPKLQCQKVILKDGTTMYAKIKLPSEVSKQKYNRILDFIPLVSESEFMHAPDGIYTWIRSEKGFFACKVFSALEIGTLHNNLADRTQSLRIYGAGECKKTGKAVIYNLQSGTFTRNLVRNHNNVQNSIQTDFEATMRSFGIDSISRVDTSFIHKDTMPLTEKELSIYSRAGYNVFLYEDEAFCDDKYKMKLNMEKRTKEAALRFSKKNSSQYGKLHTDLKEIHSQIHTFNTYTPRIYKIGGARTRKHKRS